MDLKKLLDLYQVLLAVLPGLLTFYVVQKLTARDRKFDTIDVMLSALAYTSMVYGIWEVLPRIGKCIPTPASIGLPLTATVLGLAISVANNRGLIFRSLENVGLSNDAPWPTIWESAFRTASIENTNYAMIRLTSGLRVYGAILGFSAEPANGHLLLTAARWVNDLGEETPIPGSILLKAEDVEFVNFVPYATTERTDGNAATIETR